MGIEEKKGQKDVKIRNNPRTIHEIDDGFLAQSSSTHHLTKVMTMDRDIRSLSDESYSHIQICKSAFIVIGKWLPDGVPSGWQIYVSLLLADTHTYSIAHTLSQVHFPRGKKKYGLTNNRSCWITRPKLNSTTHASICSSTSKRELKLSDM